MSWYSGLLMLWRMWNGPMQRISLLSRGSMVYDSTHVQVCTRFHLWTSAHYVLKLFQGNVVNETRQKQAYLEKIYSVDTNLSIQNFSQYTSSVQLYQWSFNDNHTSLSLQTSQQMFLKVLVTKIIVIDLRGFKDRSLLLLLTMFLRGA